MARKSNKELLEEYNHLGLLNANGQLLNLDKVHRFLKLRKRYYIPKKIDNEQVLNRITNNSK